MEQKSFFKTIEVKAFKDKHGLPTCAINFGTGEICEFYRTTRFGTTEVCLFASEYPLLRRDADGKGRYLSGDGSLVPCKECPLWKNVECQT